MGPFVVLSLTSGPRLGGGKGGGKGVAFGRDNEGKGNGGGNFPWRKPLGGALPKSSCSSLASIGSAELDLTSERYSRSSPERVSELREGEGDTRDRENLVRKRDTADGADDGGKSSSCATVSANGGTKH